MGWRRLPCRSDGMTQTEILAEKIEAYKNTNYVVLADVGEFTLRVDQHSEALAYLFKSANKQNGTFITAYNPLGRACDSAENEKANHRLNEYLRSLGAQVIEGAGADPSGIWPPEPSFLALGIDLASAKRIGKLYKQDAIIWSDSDAIPRLILLR